MPGAQRRRTSLRFSPLSKTTTRRRARPRMSAALSPAGPPPVKVRIVNVREKHATEAAAKAAQAAAWEGALKLAAAAAGATLDRKSRLCTTSQTSSSGRQRKAGCT